MRLRIYKTLFSRQGTSVDCFASKIRLKLRLLTPVLCAFFGFSQNVARSSLEHYRAGEVLLQQGNLQSAANEFREALNGDLEPRWIEAQSHINLGRIFNMTGQYDRAANEFKQARRWVDIANDPPPPTAPDPLEKTEPEYSEEARVAELEGTVVLSATVSGDGSPHDLSVTQPLGLGLSDKAIEAVAKWRFNPGAFQGLPIPVLTSVAVDFRVPSKQSRWHLIRVEFYPPEGAPRPVFMSTRYPPGAGISKATIDEGRLLGAIGRLGTATLLFDVDEHGLPEHFWVTKASDDAWGNEAIAVVRDWRFIPGTKDGIAVAVRCSLDLIWGPRTLTQKAMAWGRAQLDLPSNTFSPPVTDVVRVQVGGAVQAAKLITKVEPAYPPRAKQAGVSGSVRINALIGADGRVVDLKPISGHPFLVPAAMEAAGQWVYQPTFLNGKPVEVTTEIVMDFAP